MPKQSQSKYVPKILQQELYRIIVTERLETVETLADIAGCTGGTMYAYAEGRRDVPHKRVKRLRRYLKGKPQCGDLAECLLEPDEKIVRRTGGETNGCVDDQIGAIIEALGRARSHFRNGEQSAYLSALRQAEHEWDTLKAEGNLINLRSTG